MHKYMDSPLKNLDIYAGVRSNVLFSFLRLHVGTNGSMLGRLVV
jgi:hypothetical protein